MKFKILFLAVLVFGLFLGFTGKTWLEKNINANHSNFEKISPTSSASSSSSIIPNNGGGSCG